MCAGDLEDSAAAVMVAVDEWRAGACFPLLVLGRRAQSKPPLVAEGTIFWTASVGAGSSRTYTRRLGRGLFIYEQNSNKL